MIASATTSKRHPPPRSVSHNSLPIFVVTRRPPPRARGTVFSMAKLRLPSFRRCRKQHRWILFRFLVPLYQKMVRCIRRRKTTEKTKDAPHSAGAKANLCDLGTLFGNYQRDPSLLLPIIFGDFKNLGILETKF